MKNEAEKEVVPVASATKANGGEFKPTITRMEKLVGQAGGVATAISIGVGVAGKW